MILFHFWRRRYGSRVQSYHTETFFGTDQTGVTFFYRLVTVCLINRGLSQDRNRNRNKIQNGRDTVRMKPTMAATRMLLRWGLPGNASPSSRASMPPAHSERIYTTYLVAAMGTNGRDASKSKAWENDFNQLAGCLRISCPRSVLVRRLRITGGEDQVQLFEMLFSPSGSFGVWT